MDYATSPVSVTPGPQPTTSIERNISASEATGFHGLLQSASTGNTTSNPASQKRTAPVGNSGDSGAQAVVQAEAGTNEPVVPAKLTIAYTEEIESVIRFAGATPAVQQDAHAMAMAVELGAEVEQAASADSTTGTDKIIAQLPAAATPVLSESLPGDTAPRANASTPHLNPDTLATNVLSAPLESGLVSTEIVNSKFSAPTTAAVAVSGLRDGAAQLNARTDAPVDDLVVTLPSRGLDLSKPVSLISTTLSTPPIDSAVASSPAQPANDTLMIAGRVGSAPLLQGQPAATDSQAADQPVLSRVLPAQGNTALPVDGKPAAASAELASTHAATVSAAATTVSTARELMARQRSAGAAAVAANDETVSQISRGGTEARMIEVNGSRATSAVATTPVTSAPAEAKTELTNTLTNAAALAVTRDENVLRVSADAAAQKQPVSKIGGVDVSQIGTVDFATARVDSTAASQPAPKLAILEPGWANQLGTDLRALVARGPSSTQLQVTPAELGPLDIEVSINRQEVSVRILAMHGQTREMLEAALPRLRDTLGQSYTSVDVSVGSGGGNSTAGGQQHNGQASTLGMMSGNQDGLSDTGSSRNNVGTEDGDSEEGVNDLSMDDQDGLMDGNTVAAKPTVARGLVDAYA